MQFVRPQEAMLLLYINIMYYSSVSFFPTAVYLQTQGGQSPVPKPAPVIPPPLYFILSTEQ